MPSYVMMCCVADETDESGRAGPACFFLFPTSVLLRLLLLLAAMAGPAGGAEETNGPTIHLGYGAEQAAPNAVADFMYFVPLISPLPVSSLTSPGCTQLVRITSTKRHLSSHSFVVTCEAELTGDGWQRSVFDLASSIRRHESQLQNGGSLARQLKSIDVEGAGAITMEVEGAVSNGLATVREVRLRFNAHGHVSPIWIDLCEIRRLNGEAVPSNEILARVNTLTFRRQPGPPTMEVSVASVKHKEAGNGFWQNLKGRLAGAAANMFIDPLTVEAAGHQAMLDFGLALVSDAPAFTFPLARNLQTNSVPLAVSAGRRPD
jgi:hypothetical protein